MIGVANGDPTRIREETVFDLQEYLSSVSFADSYPQYHEQLVRRCRSLCHNEEEATLLRGSGLQTWTFWQDWSQLRSLYPTDWQTILNNSGVIQIFGVANHGMARECSEVTGQGPEVFDGLAREDAVVLRQGQGSVVCRRPDYLTDDAFAGLYDANPRFGVPAQPSRWRI